MIEVLPKSDQIYWATQAQKLVWRTPWHTVFSGDFATCKWFEGGRLNITETCIDQHLAQGRSSKIALVWESENGAKQQLSYKDLHQELGDLAKGLRALGAQCGDRVAIYMPLCPKAVVAMLACARIGATHTVVFAGFSAQSLRERIDDSACRFVITADGFVRKGQVIKLKDIVDEALVESKGTVKHVIVLEHAGCARNDRDITWAACVAGGSKEHSHPEIVDAEHPLFILYTSGTTGKPKGIVHSSAGYLTQVRATCEQVFGIKGSDVFWCTADIGWITGHSYLVYGPLALGATVFMYEGALTSPSPDHFFELIDQYKVTILYTAPTAIRNFMQHGPELPLRHSLSSLRLLGSVGEPINPEASRWWHKYVGRERCPLVDTFWQTETGAIMISSGVAMPSIDAQVVDADANPVADGQSGYLVFNRPWPAIARGIYGDKERFVETYFSRFEGRYFTGDGAKKNSNQRFSILGRVDDVVNVSGHRLGTAEIESALITHADVAESAVVARPDELTGQAIVAFVALKNNVIETQQLKDELTKCVVNEIGTFARPKQINFVASLPKTRSGKIMRRVLRQIACGNAISGDLSTIEDLEALKSLAHHAPQN